jgi:hypothetical protein
MNTVGDGWNGYPITPIRLKKEWVGLTDEELRLLWRDYHGDCCLADGRILSYERAIQAKLRDKNS